MCSRIIWILFCSLLCSLLSFKSIAFAVGDIPLLQHAIAPTQNTSAFDPKSAELPPELRILQTRYLQYFFSDIDLKQTQHYFHKFEVGQYKIVAQLFLQNKDFENIIISHGYLDHSGFNQSLVESLLNNHFNVILFDQPGHGLTDGVRSEIDHFSTYQHVITETYSQFSFFLKQPTHVIGHSTGNVGIIDLIDQKAIPWSGNTIMLAPLIRSKHWGVSKFFYKIGKGIFKSIPRKFRNNSHNKTFKKWLKKEPFVIKKISKQWIDAHHIWEKNLQSYAISEQQFTVIQGRKDLIVDFKYNQKYLLKHFPNIDLIKIKGANHHLINETDEIKNNVFENILISLKQ